MKQKKRVAKLERRVRQWEQMCKESKLPNADRVYHRPGSVKK